MYITVFYDFRFHVLPSMWNTVNIISVGVSKYNMVRSNYLRTMYLCICILMFTLEKSTVYSHIFCYSFYTLDSTSGFT